MNAIKNKAGAVLLALVLSLGAYSSNEPFTCKTAVQEAIRSQLNIRVEKNEKVEMIFTTDGNGKVNLAIAKTDNKDLQKKLESEFGKLQLKGLNAGDCYSIILSLKLI